VDAATKKCSRCEHNGSGTKGSPVHRHDTIDTVSRQQEARYRALRKSQVGLTLEQPPHGPPVQATVTLRTRRPHRRSLRSVQHSELDSRQIRRSAHDASQGIYLSHHCSLRDPTDSGIAGHLADCFEILGEQEGLGAATSGKRSGFHPGVTAADDDDVEPVAHRGAPSLTVIIRCGESDSPSHQRSERRDAYDLFDRHNEVLMDRADSEPGALAHVLVL
jgi:hypothetical protein